MATGFECNGQNVIIMDVGEGKAIVLFDGVCNLCSNSVQFIIKRDRSDRFRFASLDSETGKELLRTHGVKADSIVLVEDGKAYLRSTAALRIARKLSGAYPLLYLAILIPEFIRDNIYTIIAKNRYRWFGKHSECWLPLPHLKQKFLN